MDLFQSLIFLKKNSFTTASPAFYEQHFSEHILMVASVNKIPEVEIHFSEKWLENLKESKNMSTKQEIVFDATLKA